MTYFLAGPKIPGKIVLENQVLIIGITKEVTLGDRLILVIVKLECVLVRELDHGVLERSDLFEHLACNLRIQSNSAMLKLMER